jgi:hypothetical protein
MLGFIVSLLAKIIRREEREISVLPRVAEKPDDVGKRAFTLALISDDCDEAGIQWEGVIKPFLGDSCSGFAFDLY